MKKIVTFQLDFDFEDTHLSGICRWIENSVQVEMTKPYEWFDGIKFYKQDHDLTEKEVRKIAIDLLIEVYQDLATSASAYDWFEDSMEATKRIMTDAMAFQERIAEAIPEILQDYRQGVISKHEYLRQLWLVSHAMVRAYQSV